ncbi:chorismate mutase, partial [Boletus edulis]
CYHISTMPNVTMSNETRVVPWGNRTIHYANGTTCCSSLDQVRAALDVIDAKLLELLSNRTAYSREAARFKSKEADVDDPLRDQQIINRAIDNATAVQLPQIVAQQVFQSIIDSTVEFEKCIV